MYADPEEQERPESLLGKRRVEGSVLSLGFLMTVGAHVLIPVAVLGSQWLLVLLGLAVAPEDRERPKPPPDVIAAEFVKLGKPFDPTKLPPRKVPPIAKRQPDGVVVSKDAQEKPETKEEKKEKVKEAQDSLLDNLVDRTKDFAEDVVTEEEGDKDGIADGTATEARLGDLYLGKLKVFFQKGWSVPNVVQNVDKLTTIISVKVSDDGHVTGVQVQNASGDPLFDQSTLDAVTALIQANAQIPEPPPEIAKNYYGQTLPVRFRGSEAR
jgi:TonB family protein